MTSGGQQILTTLGLGAGTFADLGGVMMGVTKPVVRWDAQPRRVRRPAPEHSQCASRQALSVRRIVS
jgi:hypothetical protein